MKSGELRQQILWLMREDGPHTAPELGVKLRRDRDITLNVIQTVLNRLVEQGLVIRSGARRHYLYEVSSTESVAKERAERAAVDLLVNSGQAGLVHFVDAVDKLDPESLKHLERILMERRKKEEQQ